MKNDRQRRLIERVAHEPGIPETLNREIARLALQRLRTAGRGPNLQHRDVAWAVDLAWREWSRRFSNALEARGAPQGDKLLNSAA